MPTVIGVQAGMPTPAPRRKAPKAKADGGGDKKRKKRQRDDDDDDLLPAAARVLPALTPSQLPPEHKFHDGVEPEARSPPFAAARARAPPRKSLA